MYRIDFKRGNEEVWMWVYPKPTAVPDPAKADLHTPDVSDFRFNAVNLGSGGNDIFYMDELRIGTTFADVCPPPPPKKKEPVAKAVPPSDSQPAPTPPSKPLG